MARVGNSALSGRSVFVICFVAVCVLLYSNSFSLWRQTTLIIATNPSSASSYSTAHHSSSSEVPNTRSATSEAPNTRSTTTSTSTTAAPKQSKYSDRIPKVRSINMLKAHPKMAKLVQKEKLKKQNEDLQVDDVESDSLSESNIEKESTTDEETVSISESATNHETDSISESATSSESIVYFNDEVGSSSANANALQSHNPYINPYEAVPPSLYLYSIDQSKYQSFGDCLDEIDNAHPLGKCQLSNQLLVVIHSITGVGNHGKILFSTIKYYPSKHSDITIPLHIDLKALRKRRFALKYSSDNDSCATLQFEYNIMRQFQSANNMELFHLTDLHPLIPWLEWTAQNRFTRELERKCVRSRSEREHLSVSPNSPRKCTREALN